MEKEDIIRDLTQKITTEALPQGHWLVERELGETYGVSRTPIREVLRNMSATGLVEQLHGKGYRVRELNFDDLIEIFNAREAVETMNARLACQYGGDRFLEEIGQFKNRLLGVDVNKSILQAMNLGRNIHDCIADAAKNKILQEVYYKLKNLVALTRIITRQIPALEENSKTYHLKIIDAIEAGDPDKSEITMREHLRLTRKLTVEGYINVRVAGGQDRST